MTGKKQKELYSFKIQDGSREREFAIISPNRKLKQDGEIYYAAQLSRFISAGILPKALWEKVMKNNGGLISDPDRKEYSALYKKLIAVNTKIIELIGSDGSKTISELDKEKADELESLQAESLEIKKGMQELENEHFNFYENTAESKARNQTILWWSMHLSMERNEKGELVDGEDIEEKLDTYDEIVEKNPFLVDVIKRLNYLVTVWYIGAATESSEFKNFDEGFLKDFKVNPDNINEEKAPGEGSEAPATPSEPVAE
jgi:hypothetical protein